jgi:hypothetical protein
VIARNRCLRHNLVGTHRKARRPWTISLKSNGVLDKGSNPRRRARHRNTQPRQVNGGLNVSTVISAHAGSSEELALPSQSEVRWSEIQGHDQKAKK